MKFVETGAYFTAVQQGFAVVHFFKKIFPVCKMVAHDGISIVLGSSDPYMNEQLLNLTSQVCKARYKERWHLRDLELLVQSTGNKRPNLKRFFAFSNTPVDRTGC